MRHSPEKRALRAYYIFTIVYIEQTNKKLQKKITGINHEMVIKKYFVVIIIVILVIAREKKGECFISRLAL